MRNLFMVLIFVTIGIFNFYIGRKIKNEQIVNVIAGFDKEKDDPKVLCDLMGNNFMAMGILGVIISLIYLIVINKISLGAYMFLYVSVMIITIINIAFKSDKYRKQKGS